MKKIIPFFNIPVLISVLVFTFALPCLAGPKAVFVNPDYIFGSLPEGQGLTHDFIVKNEGDAPLNITNVQPP